jgi:hypothetical protein
MHFNTPFNLERLVGNGDCIQTVESNTTNEKLMLNREFDTNAKWIQSFLYTTTI